MSAHLPNVAHNIFSIIPDGDTVEPSVSLSQDVIGLRQSKTTHETLHEKVVVRQSARANDGIEADTDPLLDTPNTANDSEMKTVVEETIMHTIANFHDLLEMWQGSQNLRATQKECHSRNKQMTAIRYNWNMVEILKVSWSLLQNARAAASKLSENSLLPPALSAKNIFAERTQIFNVL
jgi:hypothetical protein